MTEIIILGTASAIPDEHHENTYFAVKNQSRTILVDCAGNPIVRLKEADIDPQEVTDLILTHFHPDHVSGVPTLLMGMWLMGREKPLHIYGLHHVIDRIEGMMDFYDWGDWPGFFPVVFYRMPESELMILLKADQIKITASPVSHLVPTLGIRMDFSDTSLSYSCDTEPSPAVQKLAEGVDLLIHEATGKGKGHSSPEEAGQVARKAGAKQLCLIHYPPQADIEELARAAGTEFSGKVIVAQDLMRIKLGV